MRPASEVLIVGGGLAGAAVSISLARHGRSVTLLEKEAGPCDKVCGEFLSGEGIEALQLLGADPSALGAIPIRRVRLADQRIRAERSLPFPACSIPRRVLDEALLMCASAAGVTVERGVRVNTLSSVENGSWAAYPSSGEVRCGRQAVLATGKHDVHNWVRPAGKQSTLVGFKMHWKVSPESDSALDDAVELISFDGGYCGLQRIGHQLANHGLVVERAMLRRIGSTWDRLVAHMLNTSAHLAERLSGAFPLWRRALAISPIPYGYVQRTDERIWRVGDQAAVIPSFSGAGMSIALRSAELAARAIIGTRDTRSYRCQLQAMVNRPVSIATLVSKALVGSRSSALLSAFAQWLPASLPVIASATRISR